MSWEPDARFGRATIGGRERHGFTYARDPDSKEVAFLAIPGRITFDPHKEGPPEVEKFVVPEDQFEQIQLGGSFG